MKGLVKVTKTFDGKTNPNGIMMYRFFFEDEEGYKGQAFWKDRLDIGQNVLMSIRNYKGNWYAKAIEVIEESSKSPKK